MLKNNYEFAYIYAKVKKFLKYQKKLRSTPDP